MSPALRPLVLLVEDSDDTRELIAECLAMSGFEVRQARDGFEALAMAVAAPIPDVVLMDLGLPGIDGLEAARRLRADARTRGIPIVALTGQSAQEPPSGLSAFLTKPCLPDVVAGALRRVLDGQPRAADARSFS
ncbi:MAG TPA: response regulator [Polyangia bacterium]|nr:response regulator [Polyangia bacterium]